MRRIAAVFPELLGRQLADIGKAFADQLKSILIGFIKIIGTVKEAVAPIKAEPMNVVLNGVYILGVFLGRIGIVHTQIADAAEVFGRGKVDRQCFAVADVQIAVRFGRKAGVDLHAVAAVAFLQIFFYEFFDKVSGFIHANLSPICKFFAIITDLSSNYNKNMLD